MSDVTFDYVIVGSGSAGGVLAGRLSEDGGTSVLLLEAGPPDRSLYLRMPTALAYPLQGERFNWAYQSEPEPHMDGRRVTQHRGRVLGGSSAINGMVYMRGNPLDFDRWAQRPGLADWSWRHVLPYYIRSETFDSGHSPYRGTNGPLHTSRRNAPHPLDDVFIEAGEQAGLPLTEDTNGYQQEGVGYLDMTVHRGRRWSTADAYIRPAMPRPNLTIRTGATVRRVLFENRRATGVECELEDEIQGLRANREVILCAGAANSPQLLMLSGIGAADSLRELDIPVLQDLPGVGRNLQDHLEVFIQYESRQPVTLYRQMRPLGKALVGLRWLLTKGGWGASNHFEAGGFVCSDDDVDWPDIQYHFLPVAVSYDGTKPADCHGFQAHVGPMRPTSVGELWLRSADPCDRPAMRFNYMATDEDRAVMRRCVRLTREIFARKAFDPYRGRELSPGADVQSDRDIDAFAAAKGESAYHVCGTCRMGEDELAVTDGEGRVYGVENLRVVDASLMPRIINSNTNAAVIMIAEKIADRIRGREPLPPTELPCYRKSTCGRSG